MEAFMVIHRELTNKNEYNYVYMYNYIDGKLTHQNGGIMGVISWDYDWIWLYTHIELNGQFFLAMCNYCNPKYNPQYTPITKMYIRIYIYIYIHMYIYICILIISTLKIRRWESTGLQCEAGCFMGYVCGIQTDIEWMELDILSNPGAK